MLSPHFEGGSPMKSALFVAASALLLGACDNSPKVEVKNATTNQVAAAVKQSGVMDSDTMVQPGLWQSKVTIEQLNMPGMPPEFADKMKQSMAETKQQASEHCLTEADVKKPKEDFFGGADKSCRYEHFTMGGGKIDIAMVCKQDNGAQTTSMTGTYTRTSYSMDMSSSGTGDSRGMTMKMHVESRRVGECSAKQG